MEVYSRDGPLSETHLIHNRTNLRERANDRKDGMDFGMERMKSAGGARLFLVSGFSSLVLVPNPATGWERERRFLIPDFELVILDYGPFDGSTRNTWWSMTAERWRSRPERITTQFDKRSEMQRGLPISWQRKPVRS